MPTSPDEAQDIAAYANNMLRELRSMKSPEAVNRVYAAWLDYANSRGVCAQIREHFSYARAECEGITRRAQKAAANATASRIIGEGK